MPKNIEIKASVSSVEEILPEVVAIADNRPVELVQDDTFFPCGTGRLKLRSFSTEEG